MDGSTRRSTSRSAERGAGRGTDPGDGPQAPGQLGVEEVGHAGIGLVDLSLEQVVLVEQEAYLEGHLLVELGDGDAVRGSGLEPLRPRLAQAAVARAGVGLGERADPTLPCGLAQFHTAERVVGSGSVVHGHEGEAPRIGRVGLRPVHPALGKVLRAQRVDEGHRYAVSPKMRGQWHPVVARGLQRHRSDRLDLVCEPGVEAVEAGPVLADAQDLPVGLVPSFPAPGDRVLPAPDVDAHRDHRSSPSDTQGCPHRPVDVS